MTHAWATLDVTVGRLRYCSRGWNGCQSLLSSWRSQGKWYAPLTGSPAMLVCRSGFLFLSIARQFVMADTPQMSFLCVFSLCPDAIFVLMVFLHKLLFGSQKDYAPKHTGPRTGFLSSEIRCSKPLWPTDKCFERKELVLQTNLAHAPGGALESPHSPFAPWLWEVCASPGAS